MYFCVFEGIPPTSILHRILVKVILVVMKQLKQFQEEVIGRSNPVEGSENFLGFLWNCFSRFTKARITGHCDIIYSSHTELRNLCFLLNLGSFSFSSLVFFSVVQFHVIHISTSRSFYSMNRGRKI